MQSSSGNIFFRREVRSLRLPTRLLNLSQSDADVPLSPEDMGAHLSLNIFSCEASLVANKDCCAGVCLQIEVFCVKRVAKSVRVCGVLRDE